MTTKHFRSAVLLGALLSLAGGGCAKGRGQEAEAPAAAPATGGAAHGSSTTDEGPRARGAGTHGPGAGHGAITGGGSGTGGASLSGGASYSGGGSYTGGDSLHRGVE